MPRGAPQGNQYAKKAKRERGITFSYYLDAYEYEFLQKSVEYDGIEPTNENVRAKAKALAKEAIRQDMVQTFARYKQEKDKTMNTSKVYETLDAVLHGADVAEYEFDNYVVAVGERNDKDGVGYALTVSKEALPPHVYERMTSLEEVEEYLNGTLGYTKGARKWTAVEREDD